MSRFKPGQSGNPAGRPKGSRNKLTQTTLDALAAHMEEHGADLIAEVAQKSPAAFLRLVVSVMPRALADAEPFVEYAVIATEPMDSDDWLKKYKPNA